MRNDDRSKNSNKWGRIPEQHQQQRNQNRNCAGKKQSNSDDATVVCPNYWKLEDCLKRYNSKDPNLIRGELRVLPGRDATSFCSCDRGFQKKDVVIEGPLQRNRALHGDVVFVELLPDEEEKEKDTDDCNNDNNRGGNKEEKEEDTNIAASREKKEEKASLDDREEGGDEIVESWWQEDPMQMDLWAPIVPIKRSNVIPREERSENDGAEEINNSGGLRCGQKLGRVVHVVPPTKNLTSEIHPTQGTNIFPFRSIVGNLKRLRSGTTLLTCTNRSLSQFRLNNYDAARFKDSPHDAIFKAKYTYGSWKENFKWPPCTDVEQFGLSCNIEDETAALLIENGVDHGDFPQEVLLECGTVVASGEYSTGQDSGWKPIPAMCEGRRDYRKRRIFTIDPTTAKDLDDALHIEELDNGQIELGVHIADVSHFVELDSHIDIEARRRCTTVYLVDRTVPMLPRPLCEIACSLNENVERLAFSCVWKMNRDGSLVKGPDSVWYGRSVIKSCARLDYATAQNIIEKKVAFGENEIDENFWPKSRRPTGGHTIDEVAADVRLMNGVAQARRQLRFQNGAVALNSVKLSFQLDGDGETPLLCQPYLIRDSNRLVEEYMLIANFLVAQRLITHAGGRACLRSHAAPSYRGLEKVAEMAKRSIGFHIDIESSEGLQRSLNRLGRECQDELVLKCITEMLTLPMTSATYIAAATVPDIQWAHFALNIPYYTHFTSPIRRYADVIVHRLLRATLDGDEAVASYPWDPQEINKVCQVCNKKKESSRKAQDRSDVVFLALYLKRNPMKSQLGVVLSVGTKTFTVFVPSLGESVMVFLDEHKDWIGSEAYKHLGKEDRIKLERTASHNGELWKDLIIKIFTKLRVTCKCNDKPPIGVKLELEGP